MHNNGTHKEDGIDDAREAHNYAELRYAIDPSVKSSPNNVTKKLT